MLCALILYVSGGTYSLTSAPNDRFYLETFYGNFYFLSEFLPEICWEEIAEEIFFIIIFDDWPGIRTQAFASNKPTHYVLDHADFIPCIPKRILLMYLEVLKNISKYRYLQLYRYLYYIDTYNYIDTFNYIFPNKRLLAS